MAMETSKTNIYLPDIVGGGYGAFWRSRKRYRVVKGGKASKKSTTTALNLIVRLIQYPKANLLVVRRVMDTHRSSTFAQLRWAAQRLKVDHLFKWSVSPLEGTYTPTGQKILFRGMDDVMKLASVTVDQGVLCWVWIEEAFEIEREEDFDLLDLSVPRGQMPNGYFKQTTITLNPWSDRHWIKSRFFEKANTHVDAFTTNYLCNEFLDETDIAIYEQMRVDNPRKYAVAGLGEWGVAEGLVFDRWSIGDTSIAKEDVWKWQRVFGLDYGYTNDPTAFIVLDVNRIDKKLYIIDEHYEKRMLNGDIADMIKTKGYAKEKICADAAEPKSNEELRRAGITRIKAAAKGKDSIRAGIAKIQEYDITVNPSCTNTIGELSTYEWDIDKSGSGINKPVDRDNHLMDAMRYAMEEIVHDPIEPRKKVYVDRLKFADDETPIVQNVTARDFKGGWF